MTHAPIRRALLSVYDKTGLIDLARALAERNIELLASGGTGRALEQAGLPVMPVERFTGAAEVLGGRVKTLHPKVHAGILADRRDPEHLTQLERSEYVPIDLVVCNLYPFESRLAEGADHATMVETIDIGGPTLVRAAAKNADGGVTVLTDPAEYAEVIEALETHGGVPLALRQMLAARAFARVAAYDLVIAGWTRSVASEPAEGTPLPAKLDTMTHAAPLRYGENPHQSAALYVEHSGTTGVAKGRVLTGKPLSYNNFLDMDAAYRAAWLSTRDDLARCAIIKHTNPCGLAEHAHQAEAFRRALAGDPVSAFGSIIGLNREMEAETAAAILEAKLFVECIVAPSFSNEAREALAKKQNLRLFEAPPGDPSPGLHMHRIGGGMLVQVADPGISDPEQWSCVTEKTPDNGWVDELAFAMQTVALLKSNAIALTKGRALLGAGTGQMSRVDAARHAIEKAGDQTRGAFLASDAFFPFDDCVRLAAEAGIVGIVQPGGSKRDQDSIDACNELGLVMLFTGRRHFRH